MKKSHYDEKDVWEKKKRIIIIYQLRFYHFEHSSFDITFGLYLLIEISKIFIWRRNIRGKYVLYSHIHITHTLNYLISTCHIVFMLYLTSHFSWFFSHNDLIVSGPRDLIIASRDGTLVILRLSLPREEKEKETSLYIGRYMIAASLRESQCIEWKEIARLEMSSYSNRRTIMRYDRRSWILIVRFRSAPRRNVSRFKSGRLMSLANVYLFSSRSFR